MKLRVIIFLFSARGSPRALLPYLLRLLLKSSKGILKETEGFKHLQRTETSLKYTLYVRIIILIPPIQEEHRAL